MNLIRAPYIVIVPGLVLGMVVLNYIMMLMAKNMFFKGALLQIIGAVPGSIQGALGLQIINNALKQI